MLRRTWRTLPEVSDAPPSICCEFNHGMFELLSESRGDHAKRSDSSDLVVPSLLPQVRMRLFGIMLMRTWSTLREVSAVPLPF